MRILGTNVLTETSSQRVLLSSLELRLFEALAILLCEPEFIVHPRGCAPASAP